MDGGKTTAAAAAAAPPERGSKWGLGRLGLGFLGGFVGRMLGWAWWGKAKQISKKGAAQLPWDISSTLGGYMKAT
ncbi:unnamed protein product [Prunus armeniaca]